MSKVAHYLQEHLLGEVMTSTDARRYFATDSSILQLAPALIAYPRSENDVRKACRFTWQLAERGRVIPITPRGSGSDQTGAALGSGIMLVFPAHMNRVLELDTKANTVTIEPGINYGKLQQTLHTHGRFIPAYPAGTEYTTVGGSIANNSSGEKSVKYGDTRNYVKSLRVVLANGEVIETSRLSKKELSKKLGLATFEGEIYRSLDTLLEENAQLIANLERGVVKNNAGYSLLDIRHKDGSFDLTPLIVGSQGTLGVITEAVMSTEEHFPHTNVFLASFDSLEQTQNAVLELLSLPDRPSSIELVDGNLLTEIHNLNPNQLKDILVPPYPLTALIVEFDNSDRKIKKAVKKANKVLEKYAVAITLATEPEQQQLFWKLRQTTSSYIGHNEGSSKSLPIINDGAVPPERLREYMEGLYTILSNLGLSGAMWGHAGDTTLFAQPKLNIGQVGDRQKALKLLHEYSKLVIGLGGTISSEAGDGRLRTPYLEAMYGPELYGLFQKIKQIFDPYGTMNPGVKFGTSLDDIKNMLRPDYSYNHFYDHMPRS